MGGLNVTYHPDSLHIFEGEGEETLAREGKLSLAIAHDFSILVALGAFEAAPEALR